MCVCACVSGMYLCACECACHDVWICLHVSVCGGQEWVYVCHVVHIDVKGYPWISVLTFYLFWDRVSLLFLCKTYAAYDILVTDSLLSVNDSILSGMTNARATMSGFYMGLEYLKPPLCLQDKYFYFQNNLSNLVARIFDSTMQNIPRNKCRKQERLGKGKNQTAKESHNNK